MPTLMVILVSAWASLLAVFLACWWGLARVGSEADHNARRLSQSLLLRRLARRRGDRRRADRRTRTAPIAHERRGSERRAAERRAQGDAVDAPIGGRGLELVGAAPLVS